MKIVAKKTNLSEPLYIGDIKIERDHYFTNAYIIDLPLDSTPDHVWQDIFEREWRTSSHLWDRKLFVIGAKLRLITPASDIEEKLEWVKKIIEQTNKGIDTYNLNAKAREAQMEEQLKKHAPETEKTAIDTIKNVLKRNFRAI